MSAHTRKSIIISGGDPAGIGPETMPPLAGMLAQTDAPIVYFSTAPGPIQDSFVRACEQNGRLTRTIPCESITSFINSFNTEGFREQDRPTSESESIYVVETASVEEQNDIKPGQPNPAAGAAAFRALKLSCDFILQHDCLGLLTAPVSKEWIARAHPELDFRGHTGYLARRFDSNVLMLMHGRHFSVVPLTVHIPLMESARALKKVLLDESFPEILKRLHSMKIFQDKTWAFCGLNPHGGEGGLLGTEELDFIQAGIQNWRTAGFPLEGPLPADSVFLKENRERYRLIFGCYHDQVLIPFKALEGREGINVTIGLPFPRTSPDHGTAYEIAGRGLADSTSMRVALQAIINKDFRYI